MTPRAKLESCLAAMLALAMLASCHDEPAPACVLDDPAAPYSHTLGCRADFDILAAKPLDASKVAASSAKVVVDTIDDALYFQNSNLYALHWEFVSAHLSGHGKPIVPQQGEFNLGEYYSPNRRFYLGALTYYAGPDKWAYELAPYDTASADMIAATYAKIRDASFIGDALVFHPTSEAIALVAEQLPAWVQIIHTDELWAEQPFQLLNPGETYAQLVFAEAATLDGEYLGFRTLAVLDHVPNDISVVAGLITEDFQTPLSHVNVLSRNRGTPNMALRGAWDDETLRSLDGKWVHLVVGVDDWSIEEVDVAEADAWWEANRPPAVGVPNKDLSVQTLTDIEDVLDPSLAVDAAIDEAIPAFGGKASHFAVLSRIESEQDIELGVADAFAVPVYFYEQFLADNGFDQRIATMLADDAFMHDAALRDATLAQLRADMIAAPLDAAFEAAVAAKLAAEYPGQRMRFRSSTNAEDLDGFTGAGLYESKSGALSDTDPFQQAIKQVWASVWLFRAFEEREYRSIDHLAVGMSLLVHPTFTDEEANGVALTTNIFDAAGLEPGFYINVQIGEVSVVEPNVGVSSDQLIYHFDFPGQPIVYIAHSNLIPAGTHVLSSAQLYQLGSALAAIRSYFADIYPDRTMEVEFKFDDIDLHPEPRLWIKQVRPYG